MAGVLTLYGSLNSGNCLKTRWVADTLGIPYQWVEIDTFSGETRTPDFLSINPAGQVPVAILPDGRMLAQSNAIMLHLAQDTDLIPTDPYDRSKMFEWLFWEQYSHEPAIAVRIARKYYLGQSDAELDPSLLSRGHAALERMELALRDVTFLVGGELTLADVASVAYTRVADRGGFSLAAYPAVEAWVSRVQQKLGLKSPSAAAR